MNARAKNLAKVAAFGGFILFSILLCTSWKMAPLVPSRVGDAPYTVSVQQLDKYAAFLEGQPVVVTSTAIEVHVNDTSGDVQFTIYERLFNITKRVMLRNWAPGGQQPAGQAIANGTAVVIQGTCRIVSTGFIEGSEIVVLRQDDVYLVSISGLVIIVLLLLVYFRFDVKRFQFTAKRPGKASTKPEGS